MGLAAWLEAFQSNFVLSLLEYIVIDTDVFEISLVTKGVVRYSKKTTKERREV